LFGLLFCSSAAFAAQDGVSMDKEPGCAITLTGYSCPRGVVVIADTIDGKLIVVKAPVVELKPVREY